MMTTNIKLFEAIYREALDAKNFQGVEYRNTPIEDIVESIGFECEFDNKLIGFREKRFGNHGFWVIDPETEDKFYCRQRTFETKVKWTYLDEDIDRIIYTENKTPKYSSGDMDHIEEMEKIFRRALEEAGYRYHDIKR